MVSRCGGGGVVMFSKLKKKTFLFEHNPHPWSTWLGDDDPLSHPLLFDNVTLQRDVVPTVSLPLVEQVRFVSVTAERPNHPSRSHARQRVGGVSQWGGVPVVGGQPVGVGPSSEGVSHPVGGVPSSGGGGWGGGSSTTATTRT